MIDIVTPLLSKRAVSRDMFVLRFAGAQIAEHSEPGEFVNLLLRPGPLLRRPFSVYQSSADEGWFEVLVRGVGAGTDQLLGLETGDTVSALGPLGVGFLIDPHWPAVTLISGGLGVGPMPLTARWARELGIEVTWVHGARSADDLSSEWLGDRLIEATDDGSRGFHGSAVMAAADLEAPVLACGPKPMLAAVAERWPDAQVAVETYMGCGTGVCLGCAVPTRARGYERACREGPVFQAVDVDWPALPGHLHYAVGR